MYNVRLNADSVEWSPLDFPGSSLRMLYSDPATGATTILIRMAPGAVIPAHSHSKADEVLYVLEGDFIEAGRTSGPGTFYAAKARVPHGPHTTVRGCTVLLALSAELDVILAEPDALEHPEGRPARAAARGN
jgi:mannose-6-phosphate isomerase-like protein (cupin superfamily)